MKFLKHATIAAITAVTFTNCATIVSKSRYPLTINTDPTGVKISITDGKGREVFKGKSPAIASLKSGAGYFKKAAYNVKLTLRGHEEKNVPVRFGLNGWYFGNLVLGGFLGLLIIDPLTGAMWKMKPEPVFETLSPSISYNTDTPTLKIVDIKDVPPAKRALLEEIKL